MYNCEKDNWCNQATNYFSEQNCNKLMNKPNPSRMFSVSHPPFERHPRPLWPLRHLIRVMRKHDLTNILTNFWQFLHLFWHFSTILTILTILTIFDSLNNFWEFWHFWQFLQFLTFFYIFFWQFSTIFYNFDNFDNIW